MLVLLVLAGLVNADLLGQRAAHSTAESHLRLGVFYATRGDLDQAVTQYRESVAEDPSFADGWNNLGTAYAQQGRFDLAKPAFETAILHHPEHAKALGNLAALAFQEGHPEEADSLARRTLAVARGEPDALYNAAVVIGNLGDLETARAAFHELVDHQPWNAAARVGEARALFALGRRTDALEVLQAQPSDRRTPELDGLLREWGEP